MERKKATEQIFENGCDWLRPIGRYSPIRITWPGRIERMSARQAGALRQEVDESIRPGSQNDDGDSPARQILFILDAFVHRQEDFEAAELRERKQFTVLPACKSRFRNSLAVMAGQTVLEFPGDTLVEQNPHPS